MGCEICCYDGVFKILPDKVPGAYKALMKLFTTKPKSEFYNKDIAKNDFNIREIFQTVGFEVTSDLLGGIAGLTYEWAKGYDFVNKLFETIAPFVLPGSYLIWTGEEHEQWRMAFYKGRFYTDEGEMTFPLFPWEKEKRCTCGKLKEDK